MENILKSYTIIPQHLYVDRNADRQLRDIITDMGRPGYVLVSRQMGKTNLLLNAKRELSNESDKFIYIDLSNTFDDERSCFQNIIDVALETNEDSFYEAAKIIFEKRKNADNIPPHKQHIDELRTLLSYTSGKLIIILDEIDALTKTNYSDKIFAQIRSMYFSRVNYLELERLTYILSGVVEPTEIIKDPKISPFNIGEKIFLNDFSRVEFFDFIRKAKLNDLPTAILERIFYWTNGNPRMTWDLCAEIEKTISTINGIEQIDEIVQKHYLTSFDKPPIDNIREIVIADKSIRDAIVEIDYNKGNEVADNVKSKLYLAGIINYEENNIKIKNRIIRNALNKNWLDSIEEQEQGLLDLALQFYKKKDYNKAVEYYDRFILNNEFPDKITENYTYYYLGISLFYNSSYERAIDILSKTTFTIKTEPKNHYIVKEYIGICYLNLDKIDDSLESFKYIIDNSSKDNRYYSALFNYGVACKLDQIRRGEAIEVFKKLILDENYEDITELELDVFKSKSYYNLGMLHIGNTNSEARMYFEKALHTNKFEFKPLFYINLIEATEDANEKEQLLISLIDCIIDNNLKPITKDIEKSFHLNAELMNDIFIIAFETNISLFEKLMSYAKDTFYLDKDVIEINYKLAISCSESKYKTFINILKYSYEKFSDLMISSENIFSYKTLKYLSYLISATLTLEYIDSYIKVFKIKRQEEIDIYDFKIFSDKIGLLIRDENFHSANEYIRYFINLKSQIDEDLLRHYLLFRFFDLQVQYSTGNILGANIIAKIIVNEIENKDFKFQSNVLLTNEELERLKVIVNDFLYPESNNQSDPFANNYGRNDRIKVKYNNGSIVEGKYKKFEADLSLKKCRII